MLTIRKEQFAVFQQHELGKFEDPTYLRLNELYPEKCQDFGETRLRRLIRYGVQRAASYKIGAPDDVRTYIDVMMLLGPDFDKDPAYAWAAEILNDAEVTNSNLRVTRLHETALKTRAAEVENARPS